MGIHMNSKDLPDFNKMADELLTEKFAEAEATAQSYLPRLRENIHRDTGALAESARLNTARHGSTWVATYIVGRSPEIDYVIYENARAASHGIFGTLDEEMENAFSRVFGGPPSSARGSVDHSKGEAT